MNRARAMGRWVLAVTSLPLMVACSLPHHPQGETPKAAPAFRSLKDLSGYLEWIDRAGTGELAREYDGLGASHDGRRPGDTALRLALLLAQPEMPYHDDAAAVRVLQEWEASGQGNVDSAIREFARWLRHQLGERARLNAGLEDALLRARDEKKRAEACRDKLDALKTMEKSLIERDRR